MSMSDHFGCKRCGYCCTYMDVVVQRSMSDGTMRYYHKPTDVYCPHLSFLVTSEKTQAKCAIHNESYFKACPCDLHNNPEFDPDIWHWGKDWRCIGPKLVELGIYDKRPPATMTWDELLELGD